MPRILPWLPPLVDPPPLDDQDEPYLRDHQSSSKTNNAKPWWFFALSSTEQRRVRADLRRVYKEYPAHTWKEKWVRVRDVVQGRLERGFPTHEQFIAFRVPIPAVTRQHLVLMSEAAALTDLLGTHSRNPTFSHDSCTIATSSFEDLDEDVRIVVGSDQTQNDEVVDAKCLKLAAHVPSPTITVGEEMRGISTSVAALPAPEHRRQKRLYEAPHDSTSDTDEDFFETIGGPTPKHPDAKGGEFMRLSLYVK